MIPVRKDGDFSYSIRDNIINVHLSLRFCHAGELPVAFPKVEQIAERHQPHFVETEMQLCRSEIQQSGKYFLVTYPTVTFFELVSLSTLRLVPLNIASMMAFLYAASSSGEVSSSTTSAVSSSRFASGFLRL